MSLPTLRASRDLPAFEVRDLPDSPRNLWRIVGPGVVAAGVGVSSGEFILWPYIASQVGLIFLWGAVLGVTTQFFLNMEIERYTLATGETALTGFNRLWKHWGLAFAIMVSFGNWWPGWAMSSATLTTYLFGGNPRFVAIGILLVIGASLTLAPVIYVALERLVFVKLGAVLALVVLAVFFAIDAESWRALPAGLTAFGSVPSELGFPLLMGAVAYAGAGGGQNLCQSNWIRDKGFGMGKYVPRLVSPVTGAEEADVHAASAFIFEPTAANMTRWRRWWRFVNLEQAFTFVLVTIVTIALTSMLAHSTLFGQVGLPNNVSFLKIEGQQLQATIAPWFGILFWAVGAFSLFTASMGITDYTSRLTADILKSTYMRESAISESRLYFGLVWAMVLVGCGVILGGLDQPLMLLVISACSAGAIMFLYSFLLIVLNRRALPAPIRIRSYRLAAMIWSIVLYGALAGLTIWQQGTLLARGPQTPPKAAVPQTPPQKDQKELTVRIERLDPALDRLVDPNAKIETLAEGYDWSEGPVWVKDGAFLLFSDVPKNVVHRWKEGEGAKPYLTPSGYTGSEPRGGETGSNGLTLDRNGRLVLAQHGDRRVARMEAPLSAPKPAFIPLADRFEGKRFNSPNDLVFHSNGDLYFTDPAYGMEKQWDDPRREIPYAGVFRRSAAGAVTLLTQEMTRPNGLAFSPDEKRLYVAQSDSKAAIWRVFDVKADGTLENSRILFDSTSMTKTARGLPDGLKIDVDGNLWATGPGGVLVISPEGKHLGTIMTGQATANCAFGDDGRTLYITADMYLMRVKLKAKGMGF
jgi:sugar lactone lactonase YvrE